MLSQLDNIIFPDRCEVYEVSPQRFVYPIFKNGYSSITQSGFRLLEMSELKNLDTVEIFVRDPIPRFISGVNSWLNDNIHLDRKTLLAIICNHLFLNRHFAPQFYWLVNLQRFTTAKIKINVLHNLSEITSLHENKANNKIELDITCYPKISFYLLLDKILVENLVNQTVAFSDIVQAIKKEFPDVYTEVIQRSLNLCSVLA